MTFKHDVAFSFLKGDLQLAIDFADALAPLGSFVYARKQEELAGTDGTDSFRAAFRDDSRLNVVLLRSGWGTTPWTRVEEKAIQDRCLNDGWERLLVVNLDGSRPPRWIPDVNLYLDLNTFPFAQAVGAIKRQVQQLGGKVVPVSAREVARRMVVAGEFDAATKAFFWSSEGVQAADKSVGEIVAKIGEDAASASAGSDKLGVAFGIEGGYGVVRMGAVSALFNWERSGNTCHECSLKVRVLDAPFETPAEQKQGKAFMRFGKSPQKWAGSFTVDRDPALGVCWRSGSSVLAADQVAATVLEQLAKAATAG